MSKEFVVLKKGAEEPWTMERAAKIIDLLCYCEITLKSNTEPSIVALRNRVAEMCKAEVTTVDAVKEVNESNGLIRNAVMLIRGTIRTINCHIESSTQDPLSDELQYLAVVGRTCRMHRVQMTKKACDGKTPFERLHGKHPTQEFVSFCERVLAKQIFTDPINRMNPRYKFGIWLGIRKIRMFQ